LYKTTEEKHHDQTKLQRDIHEERAKFLKA